MGTIEPLHAAVEAALAPIAIVRVGYVSPTTLERRTSRVTPSCRDPRVRVFRFSRNFGFNRTSSPATLMRAATPPFQIDCGLQPRPSSRRVVKRWEEGNSVVYGVRKKRVESPSDPHARVLSAIAWLSGTGSPRPLDFRWSIGRARCPGPHRRSEPYLRAPCQLAQSVGASRPQGARSRSSKFPKRCSLSLAGPAQSIFRCAPRRVAHRLVPPPNPRLVFGFKARPRLAARRPTTVSSVVMS